MENSWEKSIDSLENHGAWSRNKIPWFSWGYFHAFHAGMGQENCKNIPHESMGSMSHGFHANPCSADVA